MASASIRFGTSGWRGLIAGDFTFESVRLAVTAIAQHVRSRNPQPALIVGYDTRFYSEEFSRLAAQTLVEQGVRVLLSDTFSPTPAVAFEILRQKTDGAINFTASHNPAEYHGLKFSSAHGGPALPEVTRDIEARVARLAAEKRTARADASHGHDEAHWETISLREPYLKRLGELVDFDKIRSANVTLVCDGLHGCGAGYLDQALRDHGISATSIRSGRNVLFGGTGPDVSEENLAPLRRFVLDAKAHAGLATDGDADRFGIVDSNGAFISANHVLALLYDYLVETRGWKLPAARSVATTHMLDAVAHLHGQSVHQTPVGFKYIGELIRQDKIALGGEESAGLSIRGHVPEKDGILACLLVAEMIAYRRAPLAEQIRRLFDRVGAQFWPLRSNLHLGKEVKARTVERLQKDASTLLGRRVRQVDRSDGAKFIFEDGSWLLMRLSGTEPLLRVYTESASAEASAQLAREATHWILRRE